LNGTVTADADSWYHEFNNYCQYKAYDNAKILALFKVLLKDSASLWLECQTPETLADLTSLKAASYGVDARYKTTGGHEIGLVQNSFSQEKHKKCKKKPTSSKFQCGDVVTFTKQREHSVVSAAMFVYG